MTGESGREPLPPGRLVLGGILILLGAGWFLGTLGYRLRWQVILAAVLMAVGAGLLVGARQPPDRGLVALGIVLTVLLALGITFRPLVALPTPGASMGERTEQPASVSGLTPGFELGVGSLRVDLRELELPAGTTEMAASVGIGELAVRVPEGVTVLVDARVGIGEAVVAARRWGGIGVTVTEEIPGDDRVLALLLEVGIGRTEVRR